MDGGQIRQPARGSPWERAWDENDGAKPHDCFPVSVVHPLYLTPLRRINQYTGSPEMTNTNPGQVVAGRLMNKQSTTALAPRI